MRSLVKIKSSQNAEITQLFTDIGKSCPSPDTVANIYSNAIHENKILRKFPDLLYREKLLIHAHLLVYTMTM